MFSSALTYPLRYVLSFLPTRMPPMIRRNYAWELLSALFLPAAIACIEGEVLGVIAKKTFDAPDLVIAAISASPTLAMLTSILWTRLIRGRDRVRLVNRLQVIFLAHVLLLAFVPVSSAGILGLVLLAYGGRVCLTGIITARTDLWRANYPRHARGRVTGKLTIIVTIVISLTSLVLASVMDTGVVGDTTGFRIVYGASSLAGLAGVWAFSRVRWRGRAAHLSAENKTERHGAVSLVGPGAMWRILRTDRRYRRFMVAQFILGVPNLAALPIVIIGIEEHFHLGYLPTIGLTKVLPIMAMTVFIPFWAHLLDRLHIVHFRVYHAWTFVFANVLIGLGMMMGLIELLVLGRLAIGVAHAGGVLAWNHGHHDYSSRELASVYMGIHVTLTGVRGAFAPFLGTLLYGAWAWNWPGVVSIEWGGLGAATFFVLAGVSVYGALLFLRLHRETRTKKLTPAELA